jgi:flavin-binding protein dodecin
MTTLVVAELIERLEGWLDYRPMQEFCSGALKDLREAASSLAELERERDEARLDKNEWSRYHQQALFKEAQAVEALTAAEAREQALREALERARETKDTFFRNAEAWETKCNAAWVERDAAEAREQALREALKRASANVPDWEKLAWKS